MSKLTKLALAQAYSASKNAGLEFQHWAKKLGVAESEFIQSGKRAEWSRVHERYQTAAKEMMRMADEYDALYAKSRGVQK